LCRLALIMLFSWQTYFASSHHFCGAIDTRSRNCWVQANYYHHFNYGPKYKLFIHYLVELGGIEPTERTPPICCLYI
jgi:hypothetical protein